MRASTRRFPFRAKIVALGLVVLLARTRAATGGSYLPRVEVDPPPLACAGDCDGDKLVEEGDLEQAVSAALLRIPLPECDGLDRDGDGRVTVDEVIVAVAFAVHGCPGQTPPPTHTPTATRTATSTRTPTPSRTFTSTATNSATAANSATLTPSETWTLTPTTPPSATPAFTCGNGRIESGEQCDDQNQRSGDGCSAGTCEIEPGWRCSGEPSRCGGILDIGLIANTAAQTVSVVSFAANGDQGGAAEASAAIPLRGRPRSIVVMPGARRAYVTTREQDGVAIIDLETPSMPVQLPVEVTGQGPEGIGCRPDGAAVYVTDFDERRVSVLDPESNQRMAVIPVGAGPNDIAVGDGFAFVTNSRDGREDPNQERPGSVTVFDTRTNDPIKTIPTGLDPVSVAISPDQHWTYVANFSGRTVSVYDNTNGHSFVQAIDVDVGSVQPFPSALAFSADSRFAYLANWGTDEVILIDTETREPMTDKFIAAGPRPSDLAINLIGDRAYVTNFVVGDDREAVPGKVSMIDLTTENPGAAAAVEELPGSVALAPPPRPASPPPTPATSPTPTVVLPQLCNGVACAPGQVCVRDLACYLSGCPPQDECCDPADLNCGPQQPG